MRHSVCLAVAVLWASVASAQAPDAGRDVFATRCASCHGTLGNGGELGPAITARIPLRSDADLQALLREGLPNAGMPARVPVGEDAPKVAPAPPKAEPAHAGGHH